MANIKVDFPATDIVGVQFLKYDSVRQSSWNIDKRHPGYRPTSLEVDPDAKTYYYKCIEGLKPSVGDIVVVSCATGFALCKVVEINVLVSRDDWAYAVASVDMNLYEEYINKEKRKKQLLELMNARRKELERTTLFEMLAEKDATFAAMLKELKDLGGTP